MTRSSPPPGPPPADHPPDETPSDLDPVLQKLKLLEFGLYGLQQYGRNASVDVEDLGPFYRLAEEIASDLEALRARQVSLRNANP